MSPRRDTASRGDTASRRDVPPRDAPPRDVPPREVPPGRDAPPEGESDADRRRRRAQFLRELHEAKALRDRVKPRRARAARMRQAMRMRTFRW
ncbi:hypothetical protein ACFYM2_03670 [Streptomyces sp. NPDC006711]|uniref:hypothetical protein n=1 Tax=unclassified Streptomyces TaxID=2593676 RepID=UPI0036CC2A9C